MGRRKLATTVQSPVAEESLEQLSCPPSTLRRNVAAPWRRRFWIITSLASVLVLAWRVKVLDARLTEMKIHTLRIVRDGDSRSFLLARLGGMLEQSPEMPPEIVTGLLTDVRAYLKSCPERDYQYYKEFLTLLIRRDLIEQEDAEGALFKYAEDTK
jgi:hypothetical protein